MGNIKYRSLIRASKKKPHEYGDAAVGRLLAGYDAKTNTLAINKPRMTERKKIMGGRSKYSVKPFLKHELEHHEQTLHAKDLGGNQNVRRLDARYHSQVVRTRSDGSKTIDSTKYVNHLMERNANVTVINGPNLEDRDKTVKQTIGYKRKKNKVQSAIDYKDGRVQLRNMVNAGRKNK